MIDDFIVIIRSVGERTTDLCFSLVESQFPKEDIYVISNTKPFSMALRKSYELALNSGKKWMIAIDADVLLFSDSINRIIRKMEHVPDSLFFYEGLILDKISMQYRPAGQHVYRIKYLKEALFCLPEDGKELRAETYTRNRMIDNGYLFIREAEIYGLHDFEQFYFDIYRTCFLHSQKHSKLIEEFAKRWIRFSENDKDFLVAIKGMTDGLLYGENLENSPDFFRPYFNKFQSEYNLIEKEPFQIESFNLNLFVNEMNKDFEKKISNFSNKRFIYQFKERSDSKSTFVTSDLFARLEYAIKSRFKIDS